MKTLKTVYEDMVHTLLEKSKEVRESMIEEKNDFEVNDFVSSELSKKERYNLSKKIVHNKILNGNKRVQSLHDGLSEIGKILDSMGFYLGMVDGNTFRDENKGQVQLPFFRKSDNQYIAGVEIENSKINFVYENLEPYDENIRTKKRYEIIAYLT
jgi:hypothetical protein